MPDATQAPLSELVVLGLLAEKPRHGYEIEREIEARRLRAWTKLGRSLVYDVLRRLKRRKWVTVRSLEGERGPRARQCTLTPAGRKVLLEAIEHALATALLEPSRTEIALMFSGQLRDSLFRSAVGQRIKLATAELAASRAARKRFSAEEPAVRQTQQNVFDHFDALMEFELAWGKNLAGKATTPKLGKRQQP